MYLEIKNPTPMLRLHFYPEQFKPKKCLTEYNANLGDCKAYICSSKIQRKFGE
jgi:hypothetical protein